MADQADQSDQPLYLLPMLRPFCCGPPVEERYISDIASYSVSGLDGYSITRY